MKTILLMITLLMSTLWVEAMELKEINNGTKITSSLEPEDRIKTLKRRISYVGITNLPYSNPNPNPNPNISNTRSRQCSINGLELTTYFPHYVYKDLGRKVRRIPQGNTNRVDYMLGDNFNIDKRFILVSINLISVPCEFRELLVTLDTNYQIIDTLEVAIGGNHECRILTKQYRLDADLTLTVYDLLPTSDKILRYQEDQIDTYDAQRVDSHYKIDDDGKFIKLKEIYYKPQTYTIEELYQKEEHGIWNDKEEKL